MVKRWDEQSQAYVEPVNVPMRYDEDSQAYVETTGMAWDAESQAYSEVWGQKVSAYVYGAVSETVTIKKDGIIVATVATNADGVSDEQIELVYGTYTLTGSVSGWTEEQTVDKDTTKFRAMPAGALYWYGNMCTDLELGGTAILSNASGFEPYESFGTPTNMGTYFKFTSNTSSNDSGIYAVNSIDFSRFAKINAIAEGITPLNSTTAEFGTAYAANSGKNYKSSNIYYMNVRDKQLRTYTSEINNSDNLYVSSCAYHGRSFNLYALWFE